jgi:predicted hydrocarbon binding protein
MQEKLDTLKETMNFLGAITSGIEEAVGDPAKSISYLAGMKLGIRLSKDASRTDDILEAIQIVRQVLDDNGCNWFFEPFKTRARESMIEKTEDGDEVMLVFRDCMIRQSLFMFGHHQKGSLCNMMFGFFSGALKNIMDRDATMSIVHAGENACYKWLVLESVDKTEKEAQL